MSHTRRTARRRIDSSGGTVRFSFTMNQTLNAARRWPAGTMPDDGDEQNFCSSCVFGSVCLPAGVSKVSLRELHMLVEHVGPFRADEPIFRTGDSFGALFAVRGGAVKTRTIDDEGREQILGFHLPGEMVGLNAIHAAR